MSASGTKPLSTRLAAALPNPSEIATKIGERPILVTTLVPSPRIPKEKLS